MVPKCLESKVSWVRSVLHAASVLRKGKLIAYCIVIKVNYECSVSVGDMVGVQLITMAHVAVA